MLAGVTHLCICVAWIAIASARSVPLWFLGAVAVAAYFVGLIARRPTDSELHAAGAVPQRLGIGTAVTLVRVSALSLLSGYLFSPPSSSQLWHLAGLYAVIGAGDWLDGFLARRTGYETRLGELLDMRVDIVGMLVAPAVAVSVGRLPPWYLLLGVAPFVFFGGLALRRALGAPGYEERLRPSAHTRTYAGYQMALIAAAFVPLFHANVVRVVSTLFMVPPLVAFVRDWLVATGWLVPDTPGYRRFIALTLVGVRKVTPVLLRPLFAMSAIWLLPTHQPLGALWAACAAAVLLGLVPRLSVCLWLVTVGLSPSGTAAELALVAAGSSVLLLGGGYFSLYEPEEHWVFGRHGGYVAVQTTKRY